MAACSSQRRVACEKLVDGATPYPPSTTTPIPKPCPKDWTVQKSSICLLINTVYITVITQYRVLEINATKYS